VEANELVLTTQGLLLWFEPVRSHPLGPAAAHVVGYTRELTADELDQRAGMGYEIGDRTGATGLEAGMDATLAGRPGGTLRIVDTAHTIAIDVAAREFVPAADVHTTLDATVLQRSYELLAGRPGASVVIAPGTNEVLALNSSPSFDPNAFEQNDRAGIQAIVDAPGNVLTNRATHGLYSAGSTFKLVTGAAGLLSGFYTSADRINCPFSWDGVDPPRRNWEGAQGLLTIAQGLMRSCNTLFYEIGLRLYNDTDGLLSQTARQFGFGAESGIVGIPDEAGQVPDAAWKVANRGEPWYPGDEVNLSIGQGDLLITPLQLANAYSTFLADSLRAPVILQGQSAGPSGEGLPLTADQHAHLLLGLKLVTGASGTARTAFALAGYNDFGGKSGTAEDAGSQQHVLFVAFAPADSPGALAAVVFDEGQSGSIEAGPIARDMVLEALR
jgi:penicillin-binding protein 2